MINEHFDGGIRELSDIELEQVNGGWVRKVVETVVKAVRDGAIYETVKAGAGAVYDGVQGPADPNYTGPDQSGCHNQCPW